MTKRTPLNFENTEAAFAHQSDKELKEAHRLFSLMGQPWLVQIGARVTPWGLKAGLPIKGLIKSTLFKQFVGGETLGETVPLVEKLGRYGVQVILDYGVEGKEGEAAYDASRDGFMEVIRFASGQPNIPFISIKVTGMGRFGLLERMDEAMQRSGASSLQERLDAALTSISADELNEWGRVSARVEALVEAAAAGGVGLLVDAEETWIQDSVDALTMQLMGKWNRERAVVYNTVQLYRHDRLIFLKDCAAVSQTRGFILGVKLVRGAYMEKERRRAEERGYASPIQPNKESSDRDYDAAVLFCVERLERIATIVASHNEGSNALAVRLAAERGLPVDHPHLHFSQLLGMSDNITYNLAGAGCSVSKYVPFGPIGDVVPYLMRRAQENTSVQGQTGRELRLIKRELQRRRGS